MINIGDKVICIDASHKNEYRGTVFVQWVEQDKEYTVREIYDNNGITPGILLEEIRNPIVPIPALKRFQEPSFRVDRFRKLRKNSVEIAENYGELVEKYYAA